MLRIKIRQGHGGLQFYIEKVGSPKHSEGSQGVRPAYLGRGLPGRETSKCKGPEGGIALVCLRNSAETAWLQQSEGSSK